MTEEEADALDEKYTKTIPVMAQGKGGFFTERTRLREGGARMLILDEVTVRILDAKAMATHQTPSELVAALVRKDLAAAQQRTINSDR
jgi:hypothetical protein